MRPFAVNPCPFSVSVSRASPRRTVGSFNGRENCASTIALVKESSSKYFFTVFRALFCGPEETDILESCLDKRRSISRAARLRSTGRNAMKNASERPGPCDFLRRFSMPINLGTISRVGGLFFVGQLSLQRKITSNEMPIKIGINYQRSDFSLISVDRLKLSLAKIT